MHKVGVMFECLKLNAKDGIRTLAEIGADGFQILCIGSGDGPSPDMSRTARCEFAEFVASHNLEISAMRAEYGYGFIDPARNDEIVAKSKKCIDLTAELGVRAVSSCIGALPDDEKDARWGIMFDALSDLAAHAASRGVTFACETGHASIPTLKRFLDGIQGGGIGVNYDPANLVMAGFEHLDGVGIMGDYIVHTHAKDGVRVHDKPKEVPLGKGAVNFPEWIGRLDAVGYDGFLTVERSVGADPVGEIAEAIMFLRTV